MSTCTWPRGCAQDALDGELCTYHRKIETGLIDTTRAPTYYERLRLAPGR